LEGVVYACTCIFKTGEYNPSLRSFLLEDKFTDPTTGKPAEGYLVFIQKSLDNETWTNIAAAITDEDGSVKAYVTHRWEQLTTEYTSPDI